MARTYEMTWQKGADGRGGRWKKIHKGKVYYFPAPAKSDREAYRLALDAFRKIQVETASKVAPSPLQLEYAAAVKQWAEVVAWCVAHGDEPTLSVARQKLLELQSRAALPLPPALEPTDRFAPLQPPTPRDLPAGPLGRAQGREPVKVLGPVEWATPERIEREIWTDRIDVMKRRPAVAGESVAEQVTEFLEKKRLDVQLGKLTPGRFEPIRVHFEAFASWIGGTTSVKLISPKTVEDYFSHCSRLVVDGQEVVGEDGKKSVKKLSPVYAADRFAAFRRFVRWLYQREVIESFPRNLDDRGFKIAKNFPKIETMSVVEVNRLLAAAGERDRLYLLLMLNIGATQKDLSDLSPSEVDLCAGTITRKRSKTKQHTNVPTIRYKLWAETWRLLKLFASKTGDRVLVNRDGKPLWSEEIKDGRAKRNDNINSAYDRLCRKIGFRKPLKLLRKTSASMIKGHKEFTSLDQLFLCHAPRSVADRHYSKAPQELLDEALVWLEGQYQTKPEKSAESEKPSRKRVD